MSSFGWGSLVLGMPSLCIRCLSMREPEELLSTSILRGKESLPDIKIVVCRSSCFLPVPRIHGVWPRCFVVISCAVEGRGSSNFILLDIVYRPLWHDGGPVTPTGPHWENPNSPPPSPPWSWIMLAMSCPLLKCVQCLGGSLWRGPCTIGRGDRSC